METRTRHLEGIRTVLSGTFEATLRRTQEALASEGFGILASVDLDRVLVEKLGVRFRRYRILDMCDPELVHKALSIDLNGGLVFLCRIVLYEQGNNNIVVIATDPELALESVEDPDLRWVAREVCEKIRRAIEKLSEGFTLEGRLTPSPAPDAEGQKCCRQHSNHHEMNDDISQGAT
ncbi:MAG: DUF302 domain-containing protein [Bacteroidota bacterium]